MLNLFKAKSNFLQTDLHSHLIPEIDDGVKTWDESLTIVKELHKLGYTKLITTPHIISNYYPNTPDLIRSQVETLNQKVTDAGIPVEIEAGAEYFVDDHFLDQVKNKKDLLTFGDRYILLETAFMNKPIFLEEAIFDLQAMGMKPILAHPERYAYFHSNNDSLDHLIETGVLLQININSLSGYYSKAAKRLASELLEKKAIHLLGSDIHNEKHLRQLQKTIKSNLFQACRQLDLLNSSL